MRVSSETEQICWRCGASSEDVPFWRNRARFNGLQSACVGCSRQLAKRRRKRQSTEAHRITNRRWYLKNRQRILQQRRERYRADYSYRQRQIDKAVRWNWINR